MRNENTTRKIIERKLELNQPFAMWYVEDSVQHHVMVDNIKIYKRMGMVRMEHDNLFYDGFEYKLGLIKNIYNCVEIE